MKKLSALAMAAIAATVVLVYVDRRADPDIDPASNAESPRTPIPETHPTPSAERSVPIEVEAPKQAPGEPMQAGTPSVPADRTLPRRAPLLTKEEQQQLDACRAASDRKNQREQAARDAEPKDPAWAYRLEEKLREYTSQRFRAFPIEVLGIECRTSFCELRAHGFTPEMAVEIHAAIDALSLEPRGEFQGMSLRTREESGKILHIAELLRRQDRSAEPEENDAEQQTCWNLASLQTQRERAARDAEPRDAGWAEPMEQLLRQHITEKLAKHPVERLDITCRTTFCEIKASTRTPESRAAFQKVAQEVATEPWADMWSGGGGSSGYGDRWEMSQTLYRHPAL